MSVPRRRRWAGMLGKGLVATAFIALAVWSFVALLTPTPKESVVQATTPSDPVRPINQDGRIVAVTDTSVTAMGADGVPRTFLVTPDTTTVTPRGGGMVAAFAVNDEVSIVGEVRDGHTVATAVASQEMTRQDGPPMDFPAT